MTQSETHPLTEAQILDVLRHVIDPELGLNVVDLGLIYSAQADPAGHVAVAMTLTTVACPLQASFRDAVEAALWQSLPDVRSVAVTIVWDPPWNAGMISPAGRAQLGLN